MNVLFKRKILELHYIKCLLGMSVIINSSLSAFTTFLNNLICTLEKWGVFGLYLCLIELLIDCYIFVAISYFCFHAKMNENCANGYGFYCMTETDNNQWKRVTKELFTHWGWVWRRVRRDAIADTHIPNCS